MKYEYMADMQEISGLGGAYEEACRRMVVAGLEWWDAHPEANPQFHGWQGVYGIVAEDNEDAKALSAAIVAPVPDCTGAMHQAAVQTCLFVRRHGWETYVKVMTGTDPERTAP